MEHRYGRHGSRAWLRWRQRRYGRPSKLPVPVESQPAIVRVFVPTNAERIIFIVIQGAQDPDEENPNQQMIEVPAGQQMPAAFSVVPSSLPDTGLSTTDKHLVASSIQMHSLTQEERKPFYTIGYAGNDAEKQAEKDWEQEEVKSSPDLDKAARDSWYVRVENPNVLEEMNTWGRDHIRNTYLGAYRDEYERVIRSHNASLPDSTTIELQNKARNDQIEDSIQGKSLLPIHIEYRAVIRVYEQIKFDFDAEADSSYFSTLCNYVRVYQEAYERYRRQEEEAVEE